MMTRLLAPVLLLWPLAACDRSAPPPPPPERQVGAPATFANTAANQSIMQPAVIAEVEPLPAPTPSPTPVGLPSATIGFVSGTRLDDAARATLDKLLADPAMPPEPRFVLRGHTDTQGSDADNRTTSRRRAQTVRTYLVEHGVAADRISVIALGERRPVAPNATRDGADDPAGRARNRRVDVEVIATAEDPDAAPAASPDGGDNATSG